MSPDAVAADAAIGQMHEWDLRDLYPAADSPGLAADRQRAAEVGQGFKPRDQRTLGGLDGAVVGAAVRSGVPLEDVFGRGLRGAVLVPGGYMADVAIDAGAVRGGGHLRGVGRRLLFVRL